MEGRSACSAGGGRELESGLTGLRHSITTAQSQGAGLSTELAGVGDSFQCLGCAEVMLPGCGAEARTTVPRLQALSMEEEDSGRSLRPGRGGGWASIAGSPTGEWHRPAPPSLHVGETQCRSDGSQQGPQSPGPAHPHIPHGLKNLTWLRGPTGEGGCEQPILMGLGVQFMPREDPQLRTGLSQLAPDPPRGCLNTALKHDFP